MAWQTWNMQAANTPATVFEAGAYVSDEAETVLRRKRESRRVEFGWIPRMGSAIHAAGVEQRVHA